METQSIIRVGLILKRALETARQYYPKHSLPLNRGKPASCLGTWVRAAGAILAGCLLSSAASPDLEHGLLQYAGWLWARKRQSFRSAYQRGG